MNTTIEKIAKKCGRIASTESIIEATVQECINYLNGEISRLNRYGQSLSVKETNKIQDVDFAVEKCIDNIEGIKHHFGIE